MKFETRQSFGAASCGGLGGEAELIPSYVYTIVWGEIVTQYAVRGIKHTSIPSSVDDVFNTYTPEAALLAHIELPTGFGICSKADTGEYFYYLNGGTGLGTSLTWGTPVLVPDAFTKLPLASDPETFISFVVGSGYF